MRNWIFQNYQRTVIVAVLAMLVAMVAFGTVFTVRINRLGDAIANRPHATFTPPSLGGSPASPSTEATQTPHQFLSMGTATAPALDAVNAWIDWRFGDLEGRMTPSALEDATANPAPKDLKVTGQAVIEKPGPTRQQIGIPTNYGILHATCVVQDGKWLVDSLGWDEVGHG